jgi:hypothetical protein
LALVLIPTAWVVLIVLSFTWRSIEYDHFFRVRPILNALHSVSRGATADSPEARDEFLQHFPVGTDKEATLAVLSGEGFSCATRRGDLEQPVVCGLRISNPLGGYSDWIIHLQFDTASHLTEIKVEIWNVFL